MAARRRAAVADGEEVLARWWSAGRAVGSGGHGTQALAANCDGAKPGELERRTDLTPDIVRHVVRRGMSVMPFLRKTEIRAEELAALGTSLACTEH